LTRDLIFDAYRNFVGTVLEGNPEIYPQAQHFIDEQFAWYIDNVILGCKSSVYREALNGTKFVI